MPWTAHALRLRNVATFRYGQEFYRTARKAGSPIVRAYLLGHAIEMFLKSYLFKAGFTSTALKRKPHGHNLERLLATAKANGLDSIVHISPAVEEAVSALARVYPETTRYFSLFDLLIQPTIPSLTRLFHFAKALDEKLERHVGA